MLVYQLSRLLLTQRPSTSLSYEELLVVKDVYRKDAEYFAARGPVPGDGCLGKGRNLCGEGKRRWDEYSAVTWLDAHLLGLGPLSR